MLSWLTLTYSFKSANQFLCKHNLEKLLNLLKSVFKNPYLGAAHRVASLEEEAGAARLDSHEGVAAADDLGPCEEELRQVVRGDQPGHGDGSVTHFPWIPYSSSIGETSGI